jgi:hypothetical protein
LNGPGLALLSRKLDIRDSTLETYYP